MARKCPRAAQFCGTYGCYDTESNKMLISQIPDGFLDIDPDSDAEPTVSASAIFPGDPILPASFSSAIPTGSFSSSSNTLPGSRTSGTPSREQILTALKVCSGRRQKPLNISGSRAALCNIRSKNTTSPHGVITPGRNKL